MRVFITANPIELDELPGTASTIAEQLRGGALPGRTMTLKVDGIELAPDATVPDGAQVVELVEIPHVAPTPEKRRPARTTVDD